MCVAVGDDIEAGHFLLMQIDCNSVDILLAELVVHHRVKKAAAAEILRVPAWPRQRAGDGGRHDGVFGGAKHGRRLPRCYFLVARSLCHVPLRLETIFGESKRKPWTNAAPLPT